MNGNYYKTPDFVPYPNFERDTAELELPMEQSYIENILRNNKGKKAKVYVSFPDSLNWKDKIFEGIIEQSGRDHIIISDPNTGKRYMILMIYLDYVEFDEKINYKKSDLI